jgi:hypothetical protein
MSHVRLDSQSAFEQLSIEEQVEYVEANLDSIVSELMANETIPYWHREILAERMARFRWGVENAIPWEEVEKKLAQG